VFQQNVPFKGKLTNETESCFNYTGGNDTFDAHNPVNATEPPFLEDLVAAQRNSTRFNETVANCTTNNVISTSCLYDTLTTNRSDIGQSTLAGATSSQTISQSNCKQCCFTNAVGLALHGIMDASQNSWHDPLTYKFFSTFRSFVEKSILSFFGKLQDTNNLFTQIILLYLEVFQKKILP